MTVKVRCLKIVFCLFLLFSCLSIHAQTREYTWEFDTTETAVAKIVVAFDVFETDETTPTNNVHTARVIFNTNTVQNTGGGTPFILRLYVPQKIVSLDLVPSSASYSCDIIFGATNVCNSGNPPSQGCLITRTTLAGDGNYQLDITYKSVTGPLYGYVNDSNAATTRVDEFILIAENVALPATPGPSGKKEVTAQIRSVSASGMPGTPSSTNGVIFDNPPEISISNPVSISAVGYDLLAGAKTEPSTAGIDTAAVSFAGSFTDESDDPADAVTNPVPDADTVTCKWTYGATNTPVANPTVPQSITLTEGGDNYVYLVATEVLRTVPAGDIAQEEKKKIRLVVKDPPTVTVNVTNPASVPPIGGVPTDVNVNATVDPLDPLLEPNDLDVNTTDYSTSWTEKKDGVATVDNFANNTTTPAAYHIGTSGRHRITCTATDDYGITGTGFADILITPIEAMVFPPVRGVPTDPNAPEIDGILYQREVDGTPGIIQDPNHNQVTDPGEDIVENGWTGSYRITYQNGSFPANVAFQGIRDKTTSPDNLYMSFEVRNDVTFDNDDVIVLNFSADNSVGTPANDKRVFIFPLHSGIGASDVNGSGTPIDTVPTDDKYNKPVRAIQVYERSGATGWSEITDSTILSGLNIVAKVHSWQDGSTYAWDLEVKIPVKAAATTLFSTDLADNFLFYFDVIRIDSTHAAGDAGYATQFTWPRSIPVPQSELDTYEFPVNLWGNSYKTNTTACKGVYINSGSDIGIYTGTANLSSEISLTAINRFTARVSNTSEKVIEDGSNPGTSIGQPIPGQDVAITFKLAHWGVVGQDGDWRKIPSTNPSCPEPADQYNNNPTCAQDVSASAGQGVTPKYDFFLDWTLDATDNMYYSSHKHQCMKVEVDSFSDTNILQTGVARNMDFGTASEFSQIARIDAKGFGKAPAGKTKQRVYLVVTKKESTRKIDRKNNKITTGSLSSDDKKSDLPAKPASAADSSSSDTSSTESILDYIVNGYLDTGEFLVINQHKYRIFESMGSYEYIITHEGEVETWKDDIEGADKVGEDTWALDVPVEGFVDVVNRIAPYNPIFSASIHGGASTPLSAFANSYGTGWNAMIDLGIKVFPNMYLMGLAGYNWFPPVSSSGTATSIINLSLNAKYFIPVQPFLEVGIGAGVECTIQDFASINYGYDADLSLDYIINPFTVLELGTVYHSRFNQEYWFLQSHLGIMFRF